MKETNLIKVRTITAKMAKQVRIVYEGMDEEKTKIATKLYLAITHRKVAPIGWVQGKTITPNCYSSTIFWLVEFNDQVYFLEKPTDTSHWSSKQMAVHDNVPQLFIS